VITISRIFLERLRHRGYVAVLIAVDAQRPEAVNVVGVGRLDLSVPRQVVTGLSSICLLASRGRRELATPSLFRVNLKATSSIRLCRDIKLAGVGSSDSHGRL